MSRSVESERGSRIGINVMSIVGNGRGSLRSGSVDETMLGGRICISLLGESVESWSGGGSGRILGGSLKAVLSGSGELYWCRRSYSLENGTLNRHETLHLHGGSIERKDLIVWSRKESRI